MNDSECYRFGCLSQSATNARVTRFFLLRLGTVGGISQCVFSLIHRQKLTPFNIFAI